jgi:hypothetical protein
MDGTGNVTYEQNINPLIEAIKDISKQLKALQEISSFEVEQFAQYSAEGDLLEINLVTGGLIVGKLLWTGYQTLGIRTNNGKDIIVYKNSIAFIQKQ